jgi:Fe2+ or Zn2+ uptake regulation protein
MPSTTAEDLRDRGLRVTAPRLAVLELLDHGSHLPADSIVAAVRQRTGSVSTQGVYNVLGDLLAAGLVHRIEPAGSAALYELAREEKHHHLICRLCGTVKDLPCDHAASECISPPELHDFADIEAEIVFWGTCPACQYLAG